MERDEWLTPPHVLAALGAFDLDPCAPRVRPWETAAEHYTANDNGLAKPWHGRVWLNPPYGAEAPRRHLFGGFRAYGVGLLAG